MIFYMYMHTHPDDIPLILDIWHIITQVSSQYPHITPLLLGDFNHDIFLHNFDGIQWTPPSKYMSPPLHKMWYLVFDTLNMNAYTKITIALWKQVACIQCKLKHKLSTMVICESYIFEFSVSMDMEKKRIPTHLPAYLLPLIVKELKINVEQDRVVRTLNISKHKISYLV